MVGSAYKKAQAKRDGERYQWAVLNFFGNAPQRVVAKFHRLISEFCSIIADGNFVKTVSQAAQGGCNSL
jgi:hypothetical protein